MSTINRYSFVRALSLSTIVTLVIASFALAEQAGQSVTSCPSDSQFRKYEFPLFNFEVPANWVVRPQGDAILAMSPQGMCAFEVTLRSAADMGRFAHDPGKADALFLKDNPHFELIGRVFDVSIGNQVPGKRMSLGFQADSGARARSETLVAVGGNQTFVARVLLIESEYAKHEALVNRVLQSVHVTSPVLNPEAVLPTAPQVVDVRSAKEFRTDRFAFKYPDTWSQKSNGRDPEWPEMQLVQIASPDNTEVLEVRYRLISPDQRFTSLGSQLNQTAINHFGRFYPDADHLNETTGAGSADTLWYRNDLAGGTKHVLASEISAIPNYAHIAYAYDTRRVRGRDVNDLAARKMILDSFTFTGIMPTVVGNWIREGEGVNLRADHTFEIYEIRSQTNQPTRETGTYELNGGRIIMHRTSGVQPCDISVKGSVLTICNNTYIRR